MKTGVRIFRWIIISLMLQLSALLLLDIYLSRINSVEVVRIEAAERPKTGVSVKIPSGAVQIKISFDGLYVGYVRDNRLIVIDLQSRKIKKIISRSKEIFTYYRWLPDRNMIIYSLKSPDAKTGRVQVITYNMDREIERGYPGIANLPEGSEVTGIELSPLTNIVYIKVRVSNSQAVVYKFNIANNLSYVMSAGMDTVIKETNYSDNLIYQTGKNRLFVKDGTMHAAKPLPFGSRMVLLGVDKEDKVYVGELSEENYVNKIYCSSFSTEPGKPWEEAPLQKPIRPDDIIITHNGTIYWVSEAENTIYNVLGNSRIKYAGKFIEILDDYVATFENNRLRLSAIMTGEG